jgi:hypothetical protein
MKQHEGDPAPVEIAVGLRALADFIEAHPDLTYPTYLRRPSVWCPTSADEVAELIRAAKADGVQIEKQHSDTQRNVRFRFGAVKAEALVNKDEVCERVVVGQKVELVPDPTYIPPDVPLVEQVVDVTEWRCLPLLAPREAVDQ